MSVLCNQNQSGFGLIEAIVGLGVVSLSVLLTMQVMTTQQKESRFIKEQLQREALKYSTLQSLLNPANCICQFNDLPDEPFTIDTTQTILPTGFEININQWRAGCAITDNILAKAGQQIPLSTVIVDKVIVSSIKDTGTTDEFKGNLIFNIKSQIRGLNPLVIPLILTVDSTSGTAETRPIKSCGAYDSTIQDLLDRIEDLENPALRCTGDLLYNPLVNRCMCPGNAFSTSATICGNKKTCPTSEVWYGNECIAKNSFPCSEDRIWSPNFGRCLCPTGRQLNTLTMRCVPVGPGNCPDARTWVQEDRRCRCPIGHTLDRTTQQCVLVP